MKTPPAVALRRFLEVVDRPQVADMIDWDLVYRKVLLGEPPLDQILPGVRRLMVHMCLRAPEFLPRDRALACPTLLTWPIQPFELGLLVLDRVPTGHPQTSHRIRRGDRFIPGKVRCRSVHPTKV